MPTLSAEQAALLEHRGKFEEALKLYEQGARGAGDPRTVAACRAGIARTLLQTGDIRRGKQLALEGSTQLCRECAAVLEGIAQYADAAELYQKAGQLERAATLYISNKAFALAAPLMTKVATPKLHVLFARAKEAEGRFEEAAASYEAGKDYDNTARLCLKELNAPQKAFALVRRSRSVEGALKVVAYCQACARGSSPYAWLFLSLRGCPRPPLHLALRGKATT